MRATISSHRCPLLSSAHSMGGHSRRALAPCLEPLARHRSRAHIGCHPLGLLEIVEEEGLGKIKALRVTDARRGLQICELLEGFDAFRNDGHSECVAQGFDRLEHALTTRALM